MLKLHPLEGTDHNLECQRLWDPGSKSRIHFQDMHSYLQEWKKKMEQNSFELQNWTQEENHQKKPMNLVRKAEASKDAVIKPFI